MTYQPKWCNTKGIKIDQTVFAQKSKKIRQRSDNIPGSDNKSRQSALPTLQSMWGLTQKQLGKVMECTQANAGMVIRGLGSFSQEKEQLVLDLVEYSIKLGRPLHTYSEWKNIRGKESRFICRTQGNEIIEPLRSKGIVPGKKHRTKLEIRDIQEKDCQELIKIRKKLALLSLEKA